MKYFQISKSVRSMINMAKKVLVLSFFGDILGLKGGPPPPSEDSSMPGMGGMGGMGGMPGGFRFRTSGGPGMSGFHFTPSSADDIFASFFGGGNPFANMGRGRRGGSGLFGEEMEDEESSFGRSFGDKRKKAPPIKRTFQCTLEELLTGVTKRMKITKSILDSSTGKTMPVEKILEINVKPGYQFPLVIYVTFSVGNQEQK